MPTITTAETWLKARISLQLTIVQLDADISPFVDKYKRNDCVDRILNKRYVSNISRKFNITPCEKIFPPPSPSRPHPNGCRNLIPSLFNLSSSLLFPILFPSLSNDKNKICIMYSFPGRLFLGRPP